MSASFRNAQERHYRDQLEEHYQRNSRNPRDVEMYENSQHQTFIPRPYSRLRHYLPHSFGLGGIIVFGAIALSIYNSNIKESFESAYFSSW